MIECVTNVSIKKNNTATDQRCFVMRMEKYVLDLLWRAALIISPVIIYMYYTGKCPGLLFGS